MSCNEETLPRIKERASAVRRSGMRRFTTRSALRSRERRSTAKKSEVPKLNLPELESDGEVGWNSELQRCKLDFALKHPNISQTERSFRNPKMNYTAISHRAKFHYQSPNTERTYPGQSPYVMDDDSAHKYFMSGYQGVVPGYRFLVGANYPSLTHDALNDFTNAIKARACRLTKPLEKSDMAPNTAPTSAEAAHAERISRFLLYRSQTGITPNYKGHIPGHKFRFGRTFGQITKDPMNRESMAYLTAR